jgi:hypothetical protein
LASSEHIEEFVALDEQPLPADACLEKLPIGERIGLLHQGIRVRLGYVEGRGKVPAPGRQATPISFVGIPSTIIGKIMFVLYPLTLINGIESIVMRQCPGRTGI